MGPYAMFMCSVRISSLLVIVLSGSLTAQSQPTSQLFNIGRTPTAEEIAAWDISVTPDGEGLPSGSGTAAEGRNIYSVRCTECHGASGREGPHDILVGGQGTLASDTPLKTVGSFWPFAPTLWDYINRAMPFETPGTMSPDDVYSTVAYVLFLNELVAEDQLLDATTLPLIKMPNRVGFRPDNRPDVGHPVISPDP